MATGSPYTAGSANTGSAGGSAVSGTSVSSSGTAYGYDDTSADQHDWGHQTDNTTTTTSTDITTHNTTSTDENAQKNLRANIAGAIQTLITSQNTARGLLQQNIRDNTAVANQQTLENDRNSDDVWYQAQQQLQNVSRALQQSMGNGGYGSAKDSLNYLTSVYDDKSDQSILNNARKTQNEIYQDLYSANSNAVNDYNESLMSNQNELMDQVYAYLSDYNNYLGNKTDVRNRVNETNTTSTDTTTDSSTHTHASNQGSYQSTDNSTETNNNSTVNVNNTGTDYVDTTVATYLSPYLDSSGNLDYDKIGAALGINLTAAGSTDLGSQASAPKLQQQDRYRTNRDTLAALSRRYG